MTAPKKIKDQPAPRISVIGTGYLGATHAAAMAELGFDVVGVDTDPRKVEELKEGRAAVLRARTSRAHPPERRRRPAARSRPTSPRPSPSPTCTSSASARRSSPARSPRTSRYVEAAARGVAENLTHDGLIVGKSTVPVGTGARLRAIIADAVPEGIDVELVWNPEFLREGKAVDDTLSPDRLVFGGTVREGGGHPPPDLREADRRRARPVLVADLPTAELVKVSANAFLATKISFINAIAEVCDAAGADVSLLADALGHDARIGRQFLNAGLGFGGGCLPEGHPRAHAPLERARRARGGRPAAAGGRDQHGPSPAGHRPGAEGAAAARCSTAGSACSARPSSRTPTTCATRPRSTSPPPCTCAAHRSSSTTPQARDTAQRLLPHPRLRGLDGGGARPAPT